MRGKTRYQDLLSSEERISTNILADRLAQLEQDGLIVKSVDPADKRQFRYRPTKKALDLLPVVYEMARWSAAHYPSATNPLLGRAARMGKRAFMAYAEAQSKARSEAEAEQAPRRRKRPTVAKT